MFTLRLTYGDPSADGHGMSATDIYLTNYPRSKVKTAVTATERLTGVRFDNLCCDYGESALTEEQVEALKPHLDVEAYIEDDDDYRYVHDFTGLYLAFAKVSLPDLTTDYQEPSGEEIDIGGYGMFEN